MTSFVQALVIGSFFSSFLFGSELRKDIVYGQAGDVRLLLDASIPEGGGPFPVAILIHGGGWSNGDKSGSETPGSGNDITPWFAPLQAAGFTYFSINYRHAPVHRWPACFEDVQTAIRWVKAHAADYKGDPRHIVLFGHSAGGQLACLAAIKAASDMQVQAVVGFAAVTDFEADVATRGGLSKSLQALYNLPPEGTPEALAILRESSPLQQIKAGLPPFLLVHGDADRTVPIQQSLDFQRQLRARGVACDLIVVPGAPHRLVGWETFDPTYADKVVAWLRRTLTVGQVPSPAASSP